MKSDDSRYDRGKELLEELMQDKGTELIEKMSAASADLAAITIAFPFGEIYSRPGLDLKFRELITLSALIVLGAWPQFKVHVRGALSVGCTETEIKELIIQLAVYAGFPAALNAMQAAGEVFTESSESGLNP
jgi:4-carboxymuconolactone decarboxylase